MKTVCRTCSSVFESAVEYEHHRSIFFNACAYDTLEDRVCSICNAYFRDSVCSFRLKDNTILNLIPIYSGPCDHCSKPYCMTLFAFLVDKKCVDEGDQDLC
nr:hypothetical transcript [Hymenolepis microstoma]